jgi:hypothetical protein
MFFSVLGWRCTNKAKYIGSYKVGVRFMDVKNLSISNFGGFGQWSVEIGRYQRQGYRSYLPHSQPIEVVYNLKENFI